MAAEYTGQKKVVVVGAGWAGLGSAYHLARQGYAVTLLEAGAYPGGLVAGWQTPRAAPSRPAFTGFVTPTAIFLPSPTIWAFNLYRLDAIGPYSPQGLEVESPLFQEPRYLHPLGTFLYRLQPCR